MTGTARGGSVAELQYWMRARITGAPGAFPEGAEWVDGAGALGRDARLDVYSADWWLRMRDSLAEDFEALARVLGDEAFDRMARAYLRAHSPKSFSLVDLGGALPEFLAAWSDPAGRSWHADLARLERDLDRVFYESDAAPWEDRDLARLAALDPEAQLAIGVRLESAVRIVDSDWGVLAVWRGERDEPARHEGSRREHLLVFRDRQTLEPEVEVVTGSQREALAMAEQGARLGELLEAPWGAEFVDWLGRWAARGVLRLQLPEGEKR